MIRVAIIGAGLQGNRRAEALRRSRDARLSVVTSRNLSSAQALALKMNCEAGGDWRATVERPDIDAVIVCTPPHLHTETVLAALECGKHVLCEKPLARTMEETEIMVRAAKEKGLLLKCGFNHRHHPGIRTAKEYFDDGWIGRPLFLRSTYGICARSGCEREWRADPRMVSGGQLMEQGIHVIDLFRWFIGEFVGVVGMIETLYLPIKPLEDNAFVTFRAADGTLASLHSSLTQWKNLFLFEVFGADGYLIVEGLGGGYGTERLIRGKKASNEPFRSEITEFRGPDPSWEDEWKEFEAAIQEGREPMGNATDGLEAMRLVFAAYESARRRSEVSLSPASQPLAGRAS